MGQVHEGSERRCGRCRGPMVVLVEGGKMFIRCPHGPCERARQHRRSLQRASAAKIALGSYVASAGRPSVEELRRYYEHGEGLRRAIAEAREMLIRGAKLDAVAEACGSRAAKVALRELVGEKNIAGFAREARCDDRKGAAA